MADVSPIIDRLNNMSSNMTQIFNRVNDSFGWDNFMNRGLVNTAMFPYIQLFGDYWYALLIGVIAIGLYSFTKNIYYLIGFLTAALIFLRAIIPVGFADLMSLVLGFATAGLLYIAFVERRNTQEGVKG